MKPKKSTSHVTELKKRVKERILGKGEAPSSTSQTKIPQGTDVPSDYSQAMAEDALGCSPDEVAVISSVNVIGKTHIDPSLKKKCPPVITGGRCWEFCSS